MKTKTYTNAENKKGTKVVFAVIVLLCVISLIAVVSSIFLGDANLEAKDTTLNVKPLSVSVPAIESLAAAIEQTGAVEKVAEPVNGIEVIEPTESIDSIISGETSFGVAVRVTVVMPDWTDYTLNVTGTKITIPANYKEFADAGCYFANAQDSKLTLNPNNEVYAVLITKDENTFMVKLLNNSSISKPLSECTVIEAIDYMRNADSEPAIAFAGGMRIGADYSEEDINKLFGTPSEIIYSLDGSLLKYVYYENQKEYGENRAFIITKVNGVIDRVLLKTTVESTSELGNSTTISTAGKMEEKIQTSTAATTSTTKTSKPTTTDYITKSKGRIIIPDLVDLPIVFCKEDEAQAIADSGKAICFDHHGTTIAGAHSGKGFSGMKSSVPNKTYAYIDGQRYLCVSKFTGHNITSDLTDNDGNVVDWKEGVVMYTCNEVWQNVTITLWRKE